MEVEEPGVSMSQSDAFRGKYSLSTFPMLKALKMIEGKTNVFNKTGIQQCMLCGPSLRKEGFFFIIIIFFRGRVVSVPL